MRNLTALVARPQARPNPVIRAAYCISRARILGSMHPDDVAKQDFANDGATLDFLNHRAAVDPAKTTVTGWAADLISPTSGGFLPALTSSAAGSVIAAGLRASPGNTFPTASLTPLAWVSEGGASPVVKHTVVTLTMPAIRKIQSVVVASWEMMKFSNAFAVFEALFESQISYSADAAYFGTQASSGSAHAGLLNGVTPLVASSTGAALAIADDISALGAAVNGTNSSGQTIFVMSPRQAFLLTARSPDLAAGLTVYSSSAVSDGTIISLDPRSLVHASDSQPDLTWSDQAVLHLEDTSPLNVGTAGAPATVAAPTVSLFQNALAALRVTFSVSFLKRRSDCVAYTTGADWN